jgi:RimJ/RimL family protein N-acetyltransferase
MNSINILETKRLKLRQWKDDDFPLFAQMNADPDVMKYYPDVLSEHESD